VRYLVVAFTILLSGCNLAGLFSPVDPDIPPGHVTSTEPTCERFADGDRVYRHSNGKDWLVIPKGRRVNVPSEWVFVRTLECR
jgi:hypothetical protein